MHKYVTTRPVRVRTGITGYACTVPGFIELDDDGVLEIGVNYAWDGPSGPTIDTPSFMRGSLVHDALYQLIREGKLPCRLRRTADRLLRELCVEDGMWRWRAAYVYASVRLFGARHANCEEGD